MPLLPANLERVPVGVPAVFLDLCSNNNRHGGEVCQKHDIYKAVSDSHLFLDLFLQDHGRNCANPALLVDLLLPPETGKEMTSQGRHHLCFVSNLLGTDTLGMNMPKTA